MLSRPLSRVCQGLQHTSPQPRPGIDPLPFSLLPHSLPWLCPGFCDHLEWLHPCCLNDFHSYYLSNTPMQPVNLSNNSQSLNVLFPQVTSIILTSLNFLANQNCLVEPSTSFPYLITSILCLLAIPALDDIHLCFQDLH